MKKIIAIILTIIVIILGIVFIVARNNQVQPEKDLENTIIENIPTKEIPSGIKYDEDGLEVEGFEWSNPNMISGNTGDDEKFIVGAKQSQPVYYSQVDSRWRNHPYTAIGDSSQTIGTSGCGPTSAAMVVSTIKGTIIPPDMGDLYLQYGFRSANSGTYLAAFPWTAEYFGIDNYFTTYNVNDAIQALRDGYIIVASCGDGLFTYGGHLIALMGIDGDTIKVFDPYLYYGKFDTASRRGKVTVDGTTVYVSTSNFINYSGATGFYCYYYGGETPQPGPTPESTPTPSGTTMRVNTPSGVNVRSGPGTNYRIVGALPNGTTVTVYETSSNWGRIGDSQWVCTDYLTGDTPAPQPTPTPSSKYIGIVTAVHGLNIRSGPSTNYRIVGAYYYNNEITILEESGNWGRTDKGWVCLDYVDRQDTPQPEPATGYKLGLYKVNTPSGLNVRKGPSTEYRIIGAYTNGTRFDTYEINNNWARTPSGWVCLDYCDLIYSY